MARSWRNIRRVWRLAIVALGAVLVGGWLLHGALLTWATCVALQRYVDGQLSIGEVRVTPRGDLELQEVSIRPRLHPSYTITAETMRFANSVALLWSGNRVPDSIHIEGLRLRILEEQQAWVLELPLRAPELPRIPPVMLSSVEVEAPGSVVFLVQEAALRQGAEAGDVVVVANGETPEGAPFSLQGQWNRFTGAGALSITCPGLRLEAPWIRAAPQLRSTPLKHMELHGAANLRLKLVRAEASKPWAYELMLDPQACSVHLPLAGWHFTGVTGRLEWAGQELRLHGLAARFGSGEVLLSGQVSHRTQLQAEVRHVTLGDLLPAIRGALGVYASALLDGKLMIQGGHLPESWSGAVEGRLTGEQLPDGGVQLAARVEGGQLCIDEAAWSWARGRICVRARVELARGQAEGRLVLNDVPVKSVLEALGLALRAEGTCSAELSFAIPDLALGNPATWSIHGTFRVDQAGLAGYLLGTVAGTLDKQGSVVRMATFELARDDQRLVGSARADLAAGAWQLEVAGRDLQLAALEPFLPLGTKQVPFTGQISFSGQLSGYLDRPRWKLQGTASAAQLRLRQWVVRNVSVKLVAEPGRVEFRDGNAQACEGHWVFGGELRAAEGGRRVRLQGHFEALSLAALAAAGRPEISSAVDGLLKGRFQLESSFPDGLDHATWHFWIHSDRLRLGKITMWQASATGRAGRNRLVLDPWEGQLVIGPTTGSAVWQWNSSEAPIDLVLRCKAVDLARLTTTGAEPPLCWGIAAADLKGHLDPVTGAVSLRGMAWADLLGWNGLPPVRGAKASVYVEGDKLQVRELTASAWGGQLRLDLTRDLEPEAKTSCEIQLHDVTLNRLLPLKRPLPADRLAGIGSGSGRLQLERLPGGLKCQGYGTFKLEGARLAGLPARFAEGSIFFDGRQYEIVWNKACVGNGEVVGTLVVTPTDPVRFEASLAFQEISLPVIFYNVLQTRHALAGYVSGSLELSGTSRRWEDSRGVIYVARLRDADLWKLPLFEAIAEVLFGDRVRPGVFHDGRGRLTLRNGLFILDGFALRGPGAQFYVERGWIAPDSRLELELIGHAEPPLLTDMPVVDVVTRMAASVQHRLVKFYVTGTVDNPRVRPVPLADISTPAWQFFRDLLNGAPTPSPSPNRP
jgi:hypothetical protein